MGAELSYADRQPDMTKLIVAFRNSMKAPNKQIAAKVKSKFHHISTRALDYFSISYIFRLRKFCDVPPLSVRE
jgi:hypothetical protein